MSKALLKSQVRNGLEVLRLAASGYTDKQISEKLFLSPDTVRSRMKTFYTAVRARNRHHALAVALVNGWITTSDLTDSVHNLRPKKQGEVEDDAVSRDD